MANEIRRDATRSSAAASSAGMTPASSPDTPLGELARGRLRIGPRWRVAGRKVHVTVPFVTGRNLHVDGLCEQHRQHGRREGKQRRSREHAPTDAG